MSRWFRFYDDALNDPKVQLLTPGLFKVWVNLLCIASKNDGVIAKNSDLAFYLRGTKDTAATVIGCLVEKGLIEDRGDFYAPHNWDGRQYKSDIADPTAAERQKKYRNAKRNGDRNATVTVTPTRADTESEADKHSLRECSAPTVENVSREKKPRRAKARTPLPDDWKPEERERVHALSEGFTDQQIEAMGRSFRNYHVARGTLMANWFAAWQTWCANEIKYQRSNGNESTGQNRANPKVGPRSVAQDTLLAGMASALSERPDSRLSGGRAGGRFDGPAANPDDSPQLRAVAVVVPGN